MRAAANKNKQSPAKSAGWDAPKSGAPFKQALDKPAPKNGNTYPGIYDPLGQYLFAGFTVQF